MLNQLERIRRGIWLYKQPLTRSPRVSDATVSDLFVWRNCDDWETYFELIDISGLFEPEHNFENREATLIIFNENGEGIAEHRLELHPNRRKTIRLRDFIPKSAGEFGTFCIFHLYNPPAIASTGSFISERGYISYRYKDAPLRSYVHGNLDAVALSASKQIELLGASSFLRREYCLQCELSNEGNYEMFFANPTARCQRLACRLIASGEKKILREFDISMRPGGSQMLEVATIENGSARLIISSKLVMARPVIFSIEREHVNVFHG